MLSSATWFRMVVIVGSVMLGVASAKAADSKSVEHAAHDAYVSAINSNDVETLLADLTDDIVYQSSGEPEIVGKAAVRKWLAEYFGATRTHWQKTSLGFIVSGDWAFERYTYKTDKPSSRGSVTATQELAAESGTSRRRGIRARSRGSRSHSPPHANTPRMTLTIISGASVPATRR